MSSAMKINSLSVHRNVIVRIQLAFLNLPFDRVLNTVAPAEHLVNLDKIQRRISDVIAHAQISQLKSHSHLSDFESVYIFL